MLYADVHSRIRTLGTVLDDGCSSIRLHRKPHRYNRHTAVSFPINSENGPLPIGTLLSYLKSRGEGETVRPWVWVVWLLVGPIIASGANQINTYLSTRTLVRTEGIITQLVFEHSLRIRMKAEVRSAGEGSDATQVGTPSESVVGASTTDLSGIREDAVPASSSKGRNKSSDEDEAVLTPPKPNMKSSDNLVGLINNLVTTDLANLSEARNFIFLGQWFLPAGFDVICMY